MSIYNRLLRIPWLAALMVSLALFSKPALAASILDIGSNGELLGISGVTGRVEPLDGARILYDIQFKSGSFEEVFGSKESFRANQESPHYGHSLSMSGLLWHSFVYGQAESFLYSPGLINGCEGWGCRIYTPYTEPARDDENSYVTIFNPPTVEGRPSLAVQTPDARDSWGERGDNEIWAVFSYTSADVPGPSALALFAIGASGLLFRRRQNRSRNRAL